MDNIVYDNGSFYVFQYTWQDRLKGNNLATAYGIKRKSKPQDGMIFSHPDKDFCIRIADDYKNSMG